MSLWGIAWAIGRAAAPAMAEAVIHSTAMKIGSMSKSRQQDEIATVINAAAAANELANAVKHMADPATSAKIRKAMERHQTTFDEEAKRTAFLRQRAEEAQR